jgi:hypothetical protein
MLKIVDYEYLGLTEKDPKLLEAEAKLEKELREKHSKTL